MRDDKVSIPREPLTHCKTVSGSLPAIVRMEEPRSSRIGVPIPMPEHKQIGNATITVADDEFANGYQTGYLRYITTYQGHPLTDKEVYGFLARTLYDIYQTDRWNTGYILGWAAALHEPRKKDISAHEESLRQEARVSV